MTSFGTAGTALLCGAAFGWVMERSGVGYNDVIRAQFTWNSMAMMRMFLAAASTSAIVQASLETIDPTGFKKTRIDQSKRGSVGFISSFVGGTIAGLGMMLGGVCPGTLWVQIGAGVSNAIMSLGGGIVGGFVYNLIHPSIEPLIQWDYSSRLKKWKTNLLVDEVLGFSYQITALTFVTMCVMCLVALDSVWTPWTHDGTGVTSLRSVSNGRLNPVIAGMVVGSLQLPTYVVSKSLLGASTAYSTMGAQILRILPDSVRARFKYANNHLQSPAGIRQVFYGLGIVAGAMLSVGSIPSISLDSSTRFSLLGLPLSYESALGGFLAVFGGRLASGCPSGNGISGMPSMVVTSYSAIAGLFFGAYGLGYLVG